MLIYGKFGSRTFFPEVAKIVGTYKSLIQHPRCYPLRLPPRGNPTDKVLDIVTKTKFFLKIMKFVANFEKLVLES